MIWGGSLNALLAASDCLELKCLQAIGENIEKVINLFPLVFLVLQKSHVVVVIVFFFPFYCSALRFEYFTKTTSCF